MGAASAATRPHYGGVLRVEIRESNEAADPPQTGRLAHLAPGFAITRWEAGHRAVYAADENAPGGRPFLDGVDVVMGRSLREQSIDLELGKADLVEAGPGEPRRTATARQLWTSAPVRVLGLVFGPRVGDARIRQALALAVDRAAIYGVLLQRQGEISGALLPQWLSGYAFLFPAAADLPRARALAAEAPAAARVLTLSVEAPERLARSIADRIALNAHDAGLTVLAAPANSQADVRLTEARIVSTEPARALAGIAAAFGLPEPALEGSPADSPEALYAAERALLEGFRVVPLFHLPDVYAAAPRVHGGPGITPLGEWRFQDLWLEEGKP